MRCVYCGGKAEVPPSRGWWGSMSQRGGVAEVEWRCVACGSLALTDPKGRVYVRALPWKGGESDLEERVPAGCLFVHGREAG